MRLVKAKKAQATIAITCVDCFAVVDVQDAFADLDAKPFTYRCHNCAAEYPEYPYRRRMATSLEEVMTAWDSCCHNLLYRGTYVMRLSRWDLRTDRDTLVAVLENKVRLFLAPTDLTVEVLREVE